MAGRIRSEDIEAVRERARIDEIVGEHVSLRSAGGGSLKGLCPFHDERSPSFQVTPSRGLYYCFGCGEGGDVLTFLQKVEHVTFVEAVEKLAGRYNIVLRYEQGSGPTPDRGPNVRTRLVAANAAAASFYTHHLGLPDAKAGTDFLTERGFDATAVAHFGVGWAPEGWDNLGKALRSKGYSGDELKAAGLVVGKPDGSTYDRFRGRLVWPIRDLSSDVIGFGARRMREDDDGPKYLNTPETPLYKKSQALYGIDLARKVIAKSRTVVIVEGYTDVMAAHLADVPMAVATCGTAFGADHIRVLRRLLLDDDVFAGRVVFTFDGDEAGQRAAVRAFSEDQRFVAQTFVAVEPDGLDPNELRLAKGDEGVRALVDGAVPMFEFAVRSALRGFDVGTAEGRIAGLRSAAPVVARIRDAALRPEYERQLSGWLALEPHVVAKAVADAGRATGTASRGSRPTDAPPSRPVPTRSREPGAVAERTAVKVALQAPQAAGAWVDSLVPEAMTSPTLQVVMEAVHKVGSVASGRTDRAWVDAVLDAAPSDEIRAVVRELAVDPLPTENADARYCVAVIARVLEAYALRQIATAKSTLAQSAATDPGYADQFADLLALEAYRRDLRQHVAGGPDV